MTPGRKPFGLRRWCTVVPASVLAVVTIVSAGADGQDAAGRGSAPADEPPATTQPAEQAQKPEVPAGGLVGSKHDFRRPGEPARDLCTPCHTPHKVTAKLPGRATPRPWRPYMATGVELDRASLLCVSCHDGVIAPDVYRASHATRLSRQLGASSLGTGTLQSHPLGVKYPVAAPKFNPIAAVRTEERIKLPDGRIQCTTCHDPHNTGRHPKMLVISNERSRLCLSCHRL